MGFRCDSRRLRDRSWKASCGTRPPVRSIAARACGSWKRPDRRGVANRRTVLARGVRPRSASALAMARCARRDLLCAAIRLPLAVPARQLPAVAHGLPLVLRAARHGRVREPEPPPRAARPHPERSRARTIGGGDRQPERQDDRGGRSARLRRWQKDHGPQTTRDGRPRWARPRTYRSSC